MPGSMSAALVTIAARSDSQLPIAPRKSPPNAWANASPWASVEKTMARTSGGVLRTIQASISGPVAPASPTCVQRQGWRPANWWSARTRRWQWI